MNINSVSTNNFLPLHKMTANFEPKPRKYLHLFNIYSHNKNGTLYQYLYSGKGSKKAVKSAKGL